MKRAKAKRSRSRAAARPSAPRERKPTKLEALTESTAQQFAHQNSYTIHGRVRVLECEAEETDKSIAAMTNAINTLKARRVEIAARLDGLAQVLRKR